MAKPEDTSHIDRVFSEEELVDEAMNVAAADAIERHRAAGEPIVVLREGRMAHVPVEDLEHDRRDRTTALDEPLLTEHDIAAERTAQALMVWFDQRLRAINGCPNVKRAALLHQGLFKTFYEEVYPFALFVQHRYGRRDDVLCALEPPKIGGQDYDALVTDKSASPPSKTYVQLTTTTFSRDQHRRMKYFLQHGRVGMIGKLEENGGVEFVSHEDLLARAFDAIGSAAARKARFSHGPGYELVVGFDDFMWFGTEEDREQLTSFVNEQLPAWRLNVDTLHVLGMSGRTLLSFPARRR